MRDSDALHEALKKVTDRASFFNFVQALIRDREDSVAQEQISPSSPYGPDANGWENTTIEDFFEAALRCAKDAGDRRETPSWRAFAEFLYCGKIYE